MQYLLKSGVLYDPSTMKALSKIKSIPGISRKKVLNASGNTLLEGDIRKISPTGYQEGDVRNKEYYLFNVEGHSIAVSHPGYADGKDPETAGWQLNRLPEVDHAEIILDDVSYLLTMRASSDYLLTDENKTIVLHLFHRGIIGGWAIDSSDAFSPELVCGIFIFCRYLEQENEFIIV